MPSVIQHGKVGYFTEQRRAVFGDPNWDVLGTTVQNIVLGMRWTELGKDVNEAIGALSMSKTTTPAQIPANEWSSRLLFFLDERGAVEVSLEGRGLEEKGRELLRRWDSCDQTTKQKFENLAAKDDKERDDKGRKDADGAGKQSDKQCAG